jgi:hypothetical protein
MRKVPIEVKRWIAVLLVVPGCLLFAAPAMATPYTVDNLGDAHDADFPGPFDGICDAGPQDCTLRAALDETSALVSPDTITITPAGQINLTNGTLLIQDDTVVNGNAALTTIHADGTTRVMGVGAGTAVTLNDLILENGGTVGGNGAGIFSTAPSLTLNRVTVRGNTLSSGGGDAGAGISTPAVGNALTLNDSTVSGNTVTGTSGLGGGIRASGPLTLNRSTVSGNSSTLDAGGRGGGIDVSPGSTVAVSIANSTISGNHAGDLGGGGIFATTNANVTIANSTIAGNTTTGGGGGITAFGTTSAENSILADNTSPAIGSENCNAAFATALNNIDSGTGCNFGIVNDNQANVSSAALKLQPLAANGGTTQTRALLAGSVAIDAGSPGCAGLTVDQRGIARPNGSACDIGAFEFVQPVVTPPVVTPQPAPTPVPKKCKKGKKLKKGKCVKKKRTK